MTFQLVFEHCLHEKNKSLAFMKCDIGFPECRLVFQLFLCDLVP